MTHEELGKVLYDIAAPQYVTEPEIVCCQKCGKWFMSDADEWFCDDCEENYTMAELELQRRNIEYWNAHG